VGEGIRQLRRTHGPRYDQAVARGLDALLRYHANDWERLEAARETFLDLTYDTLKAQLRYFNTGEFSLPPAQRGEVHRDAELMQGPYLTGLFLASLFWPNHFAKMVFFEDVFLPLFPNAPKVLDVGSGPGLYSALTLWHRPAAELTCTDISAYSEPLVAKLRFGAERACPQPRFVQGSFPESFRDSKEKFEAIIFSDVLEHLSDPKGGLAQVRRLLAAGGAVFFATATNAAFYDHTIVFHDVQEVVHLLEQQGFTAQHWQLEPVHVGQDGRTTEDIFAVLRNRAED
jgi:SAM-dependent methyltransferase